MSTIRFMKEVIRANKSTGALAPSSKPLAEAITSLVGLEEADIIVEYGPGTGVFTETILRKKKKDAYLLALDVNPEFVKATRERCPDAVVVQDSAQNAILHLQKAGFSHCDLIISGLPWTRFDSDLQDSILNATYEVLRPGGKFVTFAFSTSLLVPSGKKFFKTKLPEKFPNVRQTKSIWKNIPPCVVFIAEKPA